MIVCICRNLNSTKVKAAIRDGARSPACVLAYHGTRFNCGKCRETISGLLTDTVAAEDSAPLQSLAAE